MKRHFCGGLLLLAAACTAPDDFVGDDVDFIDDQAFGDGAPESDADPASLTSLTVSGFEAACDEASQADPMVLEATGEATAVRVVHSGIDAHCDLDPSAFAMLNVEGEQPVIEVYYSDEAAAAATDCVCGWTFTYRVEGLEAGAYSLTAAGSTAAATVGANP